MESILLNRAIVSEKMYKRMTKNMNNPVILSIHMEKLLKDKDPDLTWCYLREPKLITYEEERVLMQILSVYPKRDQDTYRQYLSAVSLRNSGLDYFAQSDIPHFLDVVAQLEVRIYGYKKKRSDDAISTMEREVGIYRDDIFLSTQSLMNEMRMVIPCRVQEEGDDLKIENYLLQHYYMYDVVRDISIALYNHMDIGWYTYNDRIYFDVNGIITDRYIFERRDYQLQLIEKEKNEKNRLVLDVLAREMSFFDFFPMAMTSTYALCKYEKSKETYSRKRQIELQKKFDEQGPELVKDSVDQITYYVKEEKCILHSVFECEDCMKSSILFCKAYDQIDVSRMNSGEVALLEYIFHLLDGVSQEQVIWHFEKFRNLGFSVAIQIVLLRFFRRRWNVMKTRYKDMRKSLMIIEQDFSTELPWKERFLIKWKEKIWIDIMNLRRSDNCRYLRVMRMSEIKHFFGDSVFKIPAGVCSTCKIMLNIENSDIYQMYRQFGYKKCEKCNKTRRK